MRKKLIKNILWATFGLCFCAMGLHTAIRANIGTGPWDVLCLGMVKHMPITYGTASIIVSAVVLIADLFMRESIGVGTLLDAFAVGKMVDLLNFLDFVPVGHNLLTGIPLLFVGMTFQSVGQWIYMSAGLGCGPRDALMVGLGKRTKRLPIGVISGTILAVVLAVGWILGGPVGIGTLLYLSQSAIMQAVFHIAHFEPRNVHNETLRESWRHFQNKE